MLIILSREGLRPFDDLYQMGSFFVVISMKSACMWDTK